MKWQPYPKYKDSGVEWLGEVPAHWKIGPLKRFVMQRPGAIKTGPFGSQLTSAEMREGPVKVYNQRSVIDGDFSAGENYISDQKFGLLKAFETFPGDLLVTTRGTIGRAAVLPLDAEQGILHPCLLRVQVDPSILMARYLQFLVQDSHLLRTQLDLASNATTIDVIYSETMSNLLLAIPPLPEMAFLAGFLNRETARIDTLIAKQERLIELLQEKRQALISRAVTKGLNPDAAMKPSGVDWLGDVPAHWEVIRHKILFHEIDQRSDSDEGTLLTVSHITGVTPRSEKNVNMFLAETLEGYKRCRTGDLVINTMWAWMGALGTTKYDGLVSPSYNVYRPRDSKRLLPAYFDYLCRIPSYVANLKANSTGVWESRLRLYPDVFLSLMLCVPPVSEQGKIVEFLGSEVSRIAALVAKARQSIEFMREHRTALISAAVTGKIDVREPSHA